MILQRGKGEYHLKNLPGRPQHILNYIRIDGHASWAFLPKNSQFGQGHNFFFWGPTRPPALHPMFSISIPPPPWYTKTWATQLFQCWLQFSVVVSDGRNMKWVIPMKPFQNTPSTALSKAIVDFSNAVIAFLYALSLGAPDAVNPSNILFFVAMILWAARTLLLWSSIFESSWSSCLWHEATSENSALALVNLET